MSTGGAPASALCGSGPTIDSPFAPRSSRLFRAQVAPAGARPPGSRPASRGRGDACSPAQARTSGPRPSRAWGGEGAQRGRRSDGRAKETRFRLTQGASSPEGATVRPGPDAVTETSHNGGRGGIGRRGSQRWKPRDGIAWGASGKVPDEAGEGRARPEALAKGSTRARGVGSGRRGPKEDAWGRRGPGGAGSDPGRAAGGVVLLPAHAEAGEQVALGPLLVGHAAEAAGHEDHASRPARRSWAMRTGVLRGRRGRWGMDGVGQACLA